MLFRDGEDGGQDLQGGLTWSCPAAYPQFDGPWPGNLADAQSSLKLGARPF